MTFVSTGYPPFHTISCSQQNLACCCEAKERLQHIDEGGVRVTALRQVDAAEDARGNATPSASTMVHALRIYDVNS